MRCHPEWYRRPFPIKRSLSTSMHIVSGTFRAFQRANRLRHAFALPSYSAAAGARSILDPLAEAPETRGSARFPRSAAGPAASDCAVYSVLSSSTIYKLQNCEGQLKFTVRQELLLQGFLFLPVK